MPKIVKNTTTLRLLDLLAPHTCRGCGRMGTPLCDRCKKYILRTTHPLCPYCKAELPAGPSTVPDTAQSTSSEASAIVSLPCPNCSTNPDLPPAYSVGDRSGLLDLILHEYKYDSVRALGASLAELLDCRLPAFDGDVAIVPLPTATHHIRSRGFDHTLHLAKRLARLRGYTVCPLLTRAKNTTQVGAGKDQRLAQATAAYQLDPRRIINQNTTYLLLDDISTTGASIQAAIKKLRQAGASHLAVALLAISVA